jgi:hypothetical protein
MSEEEVDPYVWDRSGPADTEVERIEGLLERYRWQGKELELPIPIERRSSVRLFVGAALAAGLAVLVILVVARRGESAPGYRLVGVDGRDVVRVGETITTGDAQRAQLEIGGLGHVDVEPNTRLEVADCGADAHRLFLARGSVSARIWAPPRLFRIGSPAGESIDLGCAYRLDVSADGAVSTLRVTTGRVAFEFEGRELFVPAGAVCTSVKGRGPSAPVFERSGDAFKSAVKELEFASPVEKPAAQRLVDLARREDTLTLWHLFVSKKTDPVLRRASYDRLASEFPRRKEDAITEEGLFAGDRAMCDAWMGEMKPAWR